MAEGPVASLAAERLIRRTPDHVVPLPAEDLAYLRACLQDLAEAFGLAGCPPPSLSLLPARSLMRLLLELRQSLKPQGLEQRALVGRLAGAILRLDTACAFETARRGGGEA
ncbi:hypothetical protein GALL_386270 [mine drainage metagenome]|uniref:Uncharacterized protein n=1 Tax=mine drainage metagenome TaxID=410659 RepID=A0A1J5Q8C0_9ZZZZ